MTDTDVFKHSTPHLYDRYMGPLLFEPYARHLAEKAREEVLKLRDQFPSVEAAADFLRRQARNSDNPWQFLDAAVALGYLGRAKDARACFDRLTKQKPEHDWEEALHGKARSFAELLDDAQAFRMRIEEAVQSTRKMLKLPATNRFTIA